MGASAFGLRKAVGWGIRMARMIKALIKHKRAVSSDAFGVISGGSITLLNDGALGPRIVTARQRRLGVRQLSSLHFESL